MDTNNHSTPLPPPLSTEAPVVPQPAFTPTIATSQVKPKSSSLPMKVALVVVFLILVSGGFFVFQNYNAKPVNTMADTKQMVARPTAIPTVDSSALVVSPTVVGEIPLAITSPASGTTVISPNVVIAGITSPNADITVNDTQKTADAQGAFSVSILLDEGDNIITIMAVDANGKYAEKEIKITLNTGA